MKEGHQVFFVFFFLDKLCSPENPKQKHKIVKQRKCLIRFISMIRRGLLEISGGFPAADFHVSLILKFNIASTE